MVRICGVLIITFCFALAAAVRPQTPAPTPQTQSTQEQFGSDTSGDDVLILANITAKELRFDIVPNTRVDFPGTKTRTNIWVTQRQNLPEQVQPGVTYHDVGLQLRISTRFADIEQILRDALRDSGASGTVNSVPVTPAKPDPKQP